MVKSFDRKMRIARSEPCSISSAHAQDDRTNHSLFRNSRGAHQHVEPTWIPNLAPMSSAWWLGWSCMLGLGQMGQTSDNLIRTRDCVINLPSQDLVTHVDRLALTT